MHLYELLHTGPNVEIMPSNNLLRFLHRSLYRQRLMWTVTCWPCRTTCSSTTTQNMAEEPAAQIPQKVRPLLIWRMVGTFPITLLFAELLSLSPSVFLPFPFPFSHFQLTFFQSFTSPFLAHPPNMVVKLQRKHAQFIFQRIFMLSLFTEQHFQNFLVLVCLIHH